jgi:hypothetical protein
MGGLKKATSVPESFRLTGGKSPPLTVAIIVTGFGFSCKTNISYHMQATENFQIILRIGGGVTKVNCQVLNLAKICCKHLVNVIKYP